MPSAPRPKQWVAARNFHHAGRFYSKGQPVTIRRTIDLLAKRGDKWITRAPKESDEAPRLTATSGSSPEAVIGRKSSTTETNPEGTKQ